MTNLKQSTTHYINKKQLLTAVSDNGDVWFFIDDVMQLVDADKFTEVFLSASLPDEACHVQAVDSAVVKFWVNESGVKIMIHLSGIKHPEILLHNLYKQVTLPVNHAPTNSVSDMMETQATPLESGNGHSITLDELMQQQESEQGITPMKLETELLLKRVKAGGSAGNFLGHAFMSVCDMSNFNLSLGQLIHLDPEGFRLFHQILHMRHNANWSETENQKIANEIEMSLSLPY